MINTTLDISLENEEFMTECRSRDLHLGPFGGYKPGVQYRFAFPNGYGASVIKTHGSYGYDRDLWEVALVNTSTMELVYKYDFEIDVIPSCTDEEVNALLKKIQNYPAIKEENHD